MRKPRPDHVYIATDGEIFKIGISHAPKERVLALGKNVRLLNHWRRPWARDVEDAVKSQFFNRLAKPPDTEWFSVTYEQILAIAVRTLHILDTDEARKAGRDVLPRHIREAMMPPYKLSWLHSQAKAA